jgi:hypothetical protein
VRGQPARDGRRGEVGEHAALDLPRGPGLRLAGLDLVHHLWKEKEKVKEKEKEKENDETEEEEEEEEEEEKEETEKKEKEKKGCSPRPTGSAS